MASKYWIKLYHEILEDPKMAQLSDRLYRRTIELFLLAGKTGNLGELPNLGDMAWHLRIDTGELLHDLKELACVGIVEESADDGWLVSKFAVRQAASSDAKRMAQWRERKRQAQYEGNASVTELVTIRNVEPETEKIQKRVETEAPNSAEPEAAKRPDQLMWDALTEACHIKRITVKARGRLNKLIKWMCESGYSDADVRTFALFWTSDPWRKTKTPMNLDRYDKEFGAWVDNGKPSRAEVKWQKGQQRTKRPGDEEVFARGMAYSEMLTPS